MTVKRWCALVVLIAAPLGCGGTGTVAGFDAGTDMASAMPDLMPLDVVSPDIPPLPTDGNATSDAAQPPAMTAIRHVVLIVQENHTFDTYFGRYCTAPTGSNPTCTTGPGCCEAAPATDPTGAMPVPLDDTENAAYDPNHTQACEQSEMHGGAMDGYTTGTSCSDGRNFALVPAGGLATYRGYADRWALADRYFQPIVGQSSSNDMYFAVARRVFTDNSFAPLAVGHGCAVPAPTTQYTDAITSADLLINGGWSFAAYPEGYDAMRTAVLCPPAPSGCHFGLPITPCDYDPSDVPFSYYRQFADDPLYVRDIGHLRDDLANGTLPNFAYVKPLGYHNEHPGYGTTISDGEAYVDAVVQAVLSSPVADETLILLTWDEGGGFFDHVAPPGASTVDGEALGTRVPLLAIGRFARAHTVSHVPLEHSSVVRFLEWNFLGVTGQLGARDTQVHNIGSLLDPATTGLPVPED